MVFCLFLGPDLSSVVCCAPEPRIDNNNTETSTDNIDAAVEDVLNRLKVPFTLKSQQHSALMSGEKCIINLIL